MKKVKIESCHVCQGHGAYENGADDAYGNTISWIDHCEYCKGTGMIEFYEKQCESCKQTCIIEEDSSECDSCFEAKIRKMMKLS